MENNVQATKVLFSSRACIKKKTSTTADVSDRSPVREWKNWDGWKPLGMPAVRGLRSSDSAASAQPQLETPGREKEQADWILLLTVLTLGIWGGCWRRKVSYKASHGQKHYCSQVLHKEYSHLFIPYKKKIITGSPSLFWIKSKPRLCRTKNAFCGSNLNQLWMAAPWRVKWGLRLQHHSYWT